MDKTKLGVVAAITTLAVPAVAPAQSFADLLAPIPDAAARLQQADMQGPAPQLIQAAYHDHHHQAYATHHHHHQAYASHHHHHSDYRNYRHYRHYRHVVRRVTDQNNHHHHHHHHNHNY